MIHAEAERKRNSGDRWDRVAGRIESLLQSQRETQPVGAGPRLIVLAAVHRMFSLNKLMVDAKLHLNVSEIPRYTPQPRPGPGATGTPW